MVDNKELEEAFFNEVDLCLEDHENFQHGLEDARTAFKPEAQDCDRGT